MKLGTTSLIKLQCINNFLNIKVSLKGHLQFDHVSVFFCTFISQVRTQNIKSYHLREYSGLLYSQCKAYNIYIIHGYKYI